MDSSNRLSAAAAPQHHAEFGLSKQEKLLRRLAVDDDDFDLCCLATLHIKSAAFMVATVATAKSMLLGGAVTFATVVWYSLIFRYDVCGAAQLLVSLVNV